MQSYTYRSSDDALTNDLEGICGNSPVGHNNYTNQNSVRSSCITKSTMMKAGGNSKTVAEEN